MSGEAYKRELVRGWCDAVTAAAFVSTINDPERPADVPAPWFTIVWEPDTVEAIAYCGVTQETGALNVIVGGEPGNGDAVVAEASDAVVAALLANADPQGQLTLERTNGTAEHSAGTADRWYRLQTPLAYRYITGGP
jgi:hypothetical protein